MCDTIRPMGYWDQFCVTVCSGDHRNIFFFEVRRTAANFLRSEPHASLMQLPTVERCPSGLRSTLGKRVLGKLNRGFESHPLRQNFSVSDLHHTKI
jgi:hypothetical protein